MAVSDYQLRIVGPTALTSLLLLALCALQADRGEREELLNRAQALLAEIEAFADKPQERELADKLSTSFHHYRKALRAAAATDEATRQAAARAARLVLE